MLILGGEDEPINLHQLKFFFAIESLDPRVARIEATQTTWPKGQGKIHKTLPLTDCSNYLKGGQYESMITEE